MKMQILFIFSWLNFIVSFFAAPSTSIDNHIIRSATVTDVVPTSISLSEITGAHINTMIELSSAQILKSDLGKTFAGESNDEYDGFRTIFECETEGTIQLQTTFNAYHWIEAIYGSLRL